MIFSLAYTVEHFFESIEFKLHLSTFLNVGLSHCINYLLQFQQITDSLIKTGLVETLVGTTVQKRVSQIVDLSKNFSLSCIKVII